MFRVNVPSKCRRFFIPAVAIVAAVGATASLGCRRSAAHPPVTAAERRTHYSELPATRKTQHPELQAEIARIEGEQGLPRQIDALRASATRHLAADAAPATAEPPAEDRKNLFAAAFPSFTRRSLTEQIDAVFPRRDFTFGPAEKIQSSEIVRRSTAARNKFVEALPGEGGLGLRCRDGLLANLDVVDGAVLGARLEALNAAVFLDDRNPAAALESLRIMLRTARLLDEEYNPASRTAAVQVRAESLQLLAAIARSPGGSRLYPQLWEIVQTHTANPPGDERSWIAERAVALHTYELVRDGHFLSLLREAELENLRSKQIQLVTARTVLRKIDADEFFYLRLMRRMIAGCQRPYFERVTLLAELRQELDSLRDTPDFPLVAGMILLTDFEKGHRLLAEDAARVRALWLALQLANGKQVQSADPNPLTGMPFGVELTAERIVISGIFSEHDEPISLPRPPGASTADSPRN